MKRRSAASAILLVLTLAAGPAGADFTIEDFDPAPAADRYGSYPGEDVQPTGYSHTQYGGSNCLRLTGNTWKTLNISDLSIEIQADTVWQLEAYIPSTATVQGFGLYDGTRSLRYALECGQTAPIGEPWIVTLAGSRDTDYGLRTFTLAVGRDWIER